MIVPNKSLFFFYFTVTQIRQRRCPAFAHHYMTAVESFLLLFDLVDHDFLVDEVARVLY